eukprot:Rhum_TRINITY_DN14930_c8_g1::Rhum_TRINITY_DN14930_c8_g1_i2::g.128878::m.128878
MTAEAEAPRGVSPTAACTNRPYPCTGPVSPGAVARQRQQRPKASGGRHSARREQLREQRLLDECLRGTGPTSVVHASAADESPDLTVFWQKLTDAAKYDFTAEELTRLDPESLVTLCGHYHTPRPASALLRAGHVLEHLDRMAVGLEPIRVSTPPSPPKAGPRDRHSGHPYTHLSYPLRRDVPLIRRNPQSDFPVVTSRQQIAYSEVCGVEGRRRARHMTQQTNNTAPT